MTLWSLCQAVLLVTNGMAVLHEGRFLSKYGLGHDRLAGGDFGGRTTLRGQVAGLLHAVSYLRWPLIFINIVVVIVKIIFG
eukprot:jgi/Pico_ML_1/51505/g2528.t1